MTTTAERRAALQTPPAETNRWLVLVLVCLAQFMVVLDATISNVALPSIQADLGFSAADLQWVINGSGGLRPPTALAGSGTPPG